MPQSIVVTEPPRNYRREILLEVANKHGLSPQELLEAKHSHKLSSARQELMWRWRHELGYSLPKIARLIGLKEHTSILYGLRCYAARLPANDNRL
jgi:chromosomal replication initiation ATPase DnaA